MREVVTGLAAAAILGLAAAAAAEELTKAELVALAKIEKAQLELSAFALGGKDVAAANGELLAGLEVWPDAPRLKAEVQRLRAAPRDLKVDRKFGPKLAKKRETAYAAVAKALAEAATAVKDAHPDRYERYLGLIQRRFPSAAVLQKLKLVYFAPYFSYYSPESVRRLEAGGELVDGKWVDAAAVAKLDAAHAAWSAPWILSDEVHEVRTTLPLRTARQVLTYVGHYRRYFLERFGGLWDLQAPTGKLPVIVTRTQAELRERMRESMRGEAREAGNGAAFYLHSNGALDPCFVTFQPMAVDGQVEQLEGFEQIVIALTHEITHQICFEYCKHDCVRTRGVEYQAWSVEAIATHMGYYRFDGATWWLTKPRKISVTETKYSEGPFAWVKAHALDLPPLEKFFGLTKAQFMTVPNYHVSATVAWFLIEGEEGKHLPGFFRLLEAVHKVKDAPDTFAKSFPGVDLTIMQAEWDVFVEGIELDPDPPAGK